MACRGGGNGTFALMMEQALKCGGRAIEGTGKLLAHHGDGDINVRHAAQNIGYEVAAFEACRISPMRHFVVGRPVDIVEYRAGYPAPGELAKVVEVMAVPEQHVFDPVATEQ